MPIARPIQVSLMQFPIMNNRGGISVPRGLEDRELLPACTTRENGLAVISDAQASDQSLVHVLAAIDGDIRAGHKSGIPGAQLGHKDRNFPWLAEATSRNLRQDWQVTLCAAKSVERVRHADGRCRCAPLNII